MNQPSIRILFPTALAVMVVASMSGCGGGEMTETPEPEPEAEATMGGAGWEPVPVPADNPMSPEKVSLGLQLFFDTRLSVDDSRSCYSCHLCENGLTDGKPVAEGAGGRVLTRSSPSLWNIAYHTEFYWDGRSGSLEAQAKAAWTGGNMGADAEAEVQNLNSIAGYREQFQAVFGEDATPDNVVAAISAFEREALFCKDTAYDRWQAGDANAVGEAAKRGAELFVAKAGCATCHSGSLFTDLKYHNVGIGMDKQEPDLGRFAVTQAEADRGAFKTPSLRDISKSAPYFHNGSVATLEEAVELMTSGGIDNPHLDRENLQDRGLTDEEKSDLLEFLRALDCSCTLTQPALPQ